MVLYHYIIYDFCLSFANFCLSNVFLSKLRKSAEPEQRCKYLLELSDFKVGSWSIYHQILTPLVECSLQGIDSPPLLSGTYKLKLQGFGRGLWGRAENDMKNTLLK